MPPITQSASATLRSLVDRSLHVSSVATRSLPTRILQLVPRQNSNPSIIPTTYGSINSGPAPGTVVGIVLGSVGGFLLLLWLIYTCLSLGGWGSRSSYEEEVVVHDRRKSRHGSTRSRRVSETVEVRRAPSPVRIVPMPMPMPPPMREPVRETVIVEEHRSRERPREVSRGSDEVVVIEEHSPPRRKKSVREREERERRESGYRTVDPGAYAGAVGGRRSSGSRRER
ncbi:uncharacterized protein LY89DRAFT_73945 [Mollisia scopiformis]|uniref:Uncharacterized protein n=1 Tax=Mollisia scopiformis TaxID=149040 RepID=A0A194XAL9_MOLSC|nr:uncharacterized protein LY89DRAFT_73945 [Mollisia scopiformis]KUJ17216.1 hypothetical protein LY89DRAFT_73945 [Mollisia scopiformis]